MVWYSHLFKDFPQSVVIHTVKGFGIVNKAEIEVKLKYIMVMGYNKLWKILKEMGIPDHLTFLLRYLYAGQEATVRTGHGTTDWFQIGKGVCQGCIVSPCLINLYAEYIMRNVLEEAGLRWAEGSTSWNQDCREKYQ